MIRCKRFIYAVIFISALLAGFFLPGEGRDYVYAATGLTLQPIKVSHTLKSGEEVSGVISLQNASNQRINVDVAVEDFVPTAGSNNSINFVGRAEGNTTVRDWVSLEVPDNFIFEKGESRSIPYTIKAPPNAEPGGHFGVAFFKATEIQDAGVLKVGTRLGMLIFITVPGSRLQKGEMLDFSSPKFVQAGPVDFTVKFKNTGTVHFEPKGVITISNIFGKKVGEAPVQGQSVLPTTIKDWKVSWDAGSFLIGRYKADIVIKDGEGNVLTAKSATFYVFPLWYILIFILSVGAIFFGLKFIRKRLKFSVSFKK